MLSFSSQQLQAASGNYDPANMLAEGSFGQVFRGNLPEHGPVALKRLKDVANNGEAGFRIEAAILSKYRHANIVTLLGHCFEDGPPRENMLVFELMETGALSVCLRKGGKRPEAGGIVTLSMAERLTAASDVGRALRRTELRARLEQQQAHRRELEGMGFRRDR